MLNVELSIMSLITESLPSYTHFSKAPVSIASCPTILCKSLQNFH